MDPIVVTEIGALALHDLLVFARAFRIGKSLTPGVSDNLA